MKEEEIWSEIRALAADYKNREHPLFKDNYYSLWVRTAGYEVIAITKAGPNVDSLPLVEDDGDRITTFYAKIEDLLGFIESYETLKEVDYEYKEWAYRKLSKNIIQGSENSISKEMLKNLIL